MLPVHGGKPQIFSTACEWNEGNTIGTCGVIAEPLSKDSNCFFFRPRSQTLRIAWRAFVSAHYNYKNLCTNVDAFFSVETWDIFRSRLWNHVDCEYIHTTGTKRIPVGSNFSLLMPFNTEWPNLLVWSVTFLMDQRHAQPKWIKCIIPSNTCGIFLLLQGRWIILET